jgi:hypothetical protein
MSIAFLKIVPVNGIGRKIVISFYDNGIVALG